MASLKQLAIKGTAWSIGGYGLSQAIRFVSNVVLTRLLVPELFGLMALVNVFVMGLTLFSDIGIRPSIVQSKRGDDPLFLNTAWTLQVIRGFGLWICCLILAFPVAQFYKEPRLTWLLPMVGLVTIIAGFNSTSLATLNRKMDLGRLTIFQVSKQILGILVTVIWAWFNPTIWALVVGTLTGNLLNTIGSHRLEPDKPNRFAWDPTAIKELFSFGRWIFLSTMMTFLAGQSDRLILGKLLPLDVLGVYIVAYTLSDLPRQVLNKVGNSVIFPLVSKQADLPRPQLRNKILQKRKLLLLGTGVLLILLISCGDFLILSLYDSRYADAAWMVPILSLGLWHTTLYSTMGPCLLAIGKPVYLAQGNVVRFVLISIGLIVGFSLGGVVGAVLVVAFSDIPIYGLILYGLYREKLSAFSEDLKATALFFGAVALVLGIRFALGWGLPIDGLLNQA